MILYKYAPKIIAVTGSVGKTSTKDAICAVLSTRFFLRCSPKSYNSDVGIPLTILGSLNGWGSVSAWIKVFFEGLALLVLKNHYPGFLVVEVGADRPGDIEHLAEWLTPDIVVVTRVGDTPVHIEFFDSREALIKEKSYLPKAIKKGGTLILNADDALVAAMKDNVTADISLMTFGEIARADIQASHAEIFYAPPADGIAGGATGGEKKPEGIQCKVQYGESMFPLKIHGTIGLHFVSVALAALAVGLTQKMNMIGMLDALAHYATPPGRLKILSGVRGSLLIDDSYNASPVAVVSALDSFARLKMSDGKEETKGRKIIVLGDMLELGAYSVEEHRKIGKQAAKVANMFVAVGLRAEAMWEEALANGMNTEHARHFNDAREAAAYLKNIPREGDVVLVKGSQSMRMERIVEALLAEPQKKRELLVRQEKEWQNR